MNDQLLMQLKLAEFPFRGRDVPPTCADLIDALGEYLERVECGQPRKEWTAYSRSGAFYSGQTAEDALAILWLASKRQTNWTGSDTLSN